MKGEYNEIMNTKEVEELWSCGDEEVKQIPYALYLYTSIPLLPHALRRYVKTFYI